MTSPIDQEIIDRLQAEIARLKYENERLSKELADWKRRQEEINEYQYQRSLNFG